MDTADKEKQTDGGEKSAEAEDETGERSEGFSCFGKLIVIFLMGTTIWNWDGLWDGRCLNKNGEPHLLKKIFPTKCETQRKRTENLINNNKFINEKYDDLVEYEATYKDACNYLREAASMYGKELSKLNNAKIAPVNCPKESRVVICQEIQANDIDKICPRNRTR